MHEMAGVSNQDGLLAHHVRTSRVYQLRTTSPQPGAEAPTLQLLVALSGSLQLASFLRPYSLQFLVTEASCEFYVLQIVVPFKG